MSESARVDVSEKSLVSEHSQVVTNIITAQLFFNRLLQNENLPELLHQAIANGITILPINPDNYNLFLEAIRRLQAKSETKTGFSVQSKYSYIVSMAFANTEMQEFILPKLLTQPLEATEREIFNTQLYLRLKDIAGTSISEKIKPQLKNYIASRQPPANKLVNEIEFLYAIATLNSKNKDERDRYVLDFIGKQSDQLIQANLILAVDEDTILKLSQTEKIKLSNLFREKYKVTHHLPDLKAINVINYKMNEK